MEHALQQDRLGQVSAMAATLADKMLMERLSRGALPLENATALWTASLLLEEHEHPVPDIVSGVLSQFREVEADQSVDEPNVEPDPPKLSAKTGRRTGMAIRLLRPFRALASA